MTPTRPTLLEAIVKAVVTHSVTYFIMGLLASALLDYSQFFTETSLKVMMRPTDSLWVMVGPLFQPIRGVLFGIVFYLLREPFFGRRTGWLAMWLVLVALGILGTFGPSPGSIEGLLYTVFPLSVHLRGLPEVLLQSLLLSLIMFYWVRNPHKRWISWAMGIAFVVLMSFPILGLLATGAA
jgi:hypothetical protein